MQDKTKAYEDFADMINQSWTYAKLTSGEKQRLCKALTEAAYILPGGSYQQRYQAMQAVYSAFLYGVGYSGPNWRDEGAALF